MRLWLNACGGWIPNCVTLRFSTSRGSGRRASACWSSLSFSRSSPFSVATTSWKSVEKPAFAAITM